MFIFERIVRALECDKVKTAHGPAEQREESADTGEMKCPRMRYVHRAESNARLHHWPPRRSSTIVLDLRTAGKDKIMRTKIRPIFQHIF